MKKHFILYRIFENINDNLKINNTSSEENAVPNSESDFGCDGNWQFSTCRRMYSDRAAICFCASTRTIVLLLRLIKTIITRFSI